MMQKQKQGEEKEHEEKNEGPFIRDSNRADRQTDRPIDRQHPGGQQPQNRKQPRQTKGLFKLGELP